MGAWVLEVRYGEAGDIGAIVDVARRVQDALTATGSQQRLTLPTPDAVAAHIAAHAAYVLAGGAEPWAASSWKRSRCGGCR